MGSMPGLGRFPWSRKWQPSPVFLPGKFRGQRSPAGYTLCGHKQSKKSKQLSTHTCICMSEWVLCSGGFSWGKEILTFLNSSQRLLRPCRLLSAKVLGLNLAQAFLPSQIGNCYECVICVCVFARVHVHTVLCEDDDVLREVYKPGQAEKRVECCETISSSFSDSPSSTPV